MQIETLATVFRNCFYVSIGLFVLGLILTALTYWKLNIREVYLIKSGKAKRRIIGQLEEHNRETGKLRDDLDLDYTTGNLKKISKRLGRSAEIDEPEPPFKKSAHSGNTGKFSTPAPTPTPPPEPQRTDSVSSAGTSNAILSGQENTGETVQLDSVIPPTSEDYASRINTAYQQIETGDLGGQAVTAPPEPTVPINIISCELIIHTNEVIEI